MWRDLPERPLLGTIVAVAFALALCAIGLGVGWLTTPAHAQMPDYCSASLSARDAPPIAFDWRLRCTIQKLGAALEAERAAGAKTADQVILKDIEIARLNAILSAPAPVASTPFDRDLGMPNYQPTIRRYKGYR